jgi:esterase/lipase superfamily enzyme
MSTVPLVRLRSSVANFHLPTSVAVFLLVGACLLSACASRQPGAGTTGVTPTHHVAIPQPGVHPSNLDYVFVNYCTSRAESAGQPCETRYGTRTATVPSYGSLVVSIPRDHHSVGEIERPSCFRGEFSENPDRHVVIKSITGSSQKDFFQAVRAQVGTCDERSAFVFIHGFNTTFAEAARRTAQIAYDLDFKGSPILFSWPSHGGFFGAGHYSDDSRQNADCVPVLRDFLRDLARRSSASHIYLIAHSMGTVATAQALCLLEDQDARRFSEVILAAPDIDAQQFRTIIAPALVAKVAHLTLYASSEDRVLRISRNLNGNPRAGDTTDGVITVPGMESIDASAVDTSFFGHSYYGECRTVLDDIYYLINAHLPTARRFGMWSASGPTGSYYLFRP